MPEVQFELSGSNYNFSYYYSYKKRIVEVNLDYALAQY